MFAIFKNDLLLNFWANQVGDVFIEATIKGLKLTQSEIDMNFYFGIDSIPSFYEFDQDKKLIIKKEVISFVDEVSTDAEGNEVISQVEVKNYEVDKIVEPIIYFAKGLMIKPC
jgi:hypothetical protein